jgi:mono/diheme cytochrome c family protein
MKRKFCLLFLIILFPLLLLLGGCAAAGNMKADPTALPYTPVTIEPLEISLGDAKAGEAVFAANCQQCHSIEEAVKLGGPTLFKAGTRLKFAYIKDSIKDPHKAKADPDSIEFMPEEVGKQLAPEQIYDVIAYVRTLK